MNSIFVPIFLSYLKKYDISLNCQKSKLTTNKKEQKTNQKKACVNVYPHLWKNL